MADNFFRIRNGASFIALSSAPTNAANGDIYLDSTTGRLKIFMGSTWYFVNDVPMPLKMTASTTPDYVLNIGPMRVLHPVTGRYISIPPISGTLPDLFQSATVTIPSSSGGTITSNSVFAGDPTNAGEPATLTLSPGQLIKVGINIDAEGMIVLQLGEAAATEYDATTPATIDGTFAVGYILVSNTAGTIDIISESRIFQYVGGGGSGGTGDTTEIMETIKNYLNDSYYQLAAATVLATDEDAYINTGASSGSFSLVTKTFTLDDSETMTSTNLMSEEEFIDELLTVEKVDVVAFWEEDDVLDADMTYQVSRDGGLHYHTIEMEKVGNAGGVYRGTYDFPAQEQDDYYDNFETTTNAVALTDVAGTKEALAQKFTLTEETYVEAIELFLSGTGAAIPAGSFYLKLVNDDGAGRPNSDGLIVSSEAMDASVYNGTSPTAATFSFNTAERLVAGDYHIVIETDDVYKDAYTSNSNKALRANGDTATGDGTGSAENGGIWAASSGTTTFAFTAVGYVNVDSYLKYQTVVNAVHTLNTTSEQAVATQFTITDAGIATGAKLYFTKTGSPTGNVRVNLIRDSGGLPSTTPADTLATSDWMAASDISGTSVEVEFTFDETALTAGIYHLTVETDATYKASFSNGVTMLQLDAHTSNNGETYNGSVWTEVYGPSYMIVGVPSNLILKITAGNPSGDNSRELKGFAVFYDNTAGITPSGTIARQVFHFDSVADNDNEFTLTQFVPNPDLLQVHYVQAGQTFVIGAFSIDGQKIVFPVDTFDNGGVSADVTLIFDQTRGGAFDNSDRNAALLAGNHLGSTDTSYDRSTPGRGLFLRRPDGTLREIAINDDDEIEIYSV